MTPLSAAVKRKVLAKTASETPPDATHWSVRSMATAVGISHTSVQRIWAEAGLKPHLVRRFKISNDPQFEEKVTDVVGLYMNPPDRALVLCVDEKSQIQALDRTQPGLPMKKGRAATMTHDYKRHGTTTLFAALDVKSGLVIGECQPRHRAKEFIRFLKRIDRAVQKHLDLHLVLDNYGTHKTAEVKAWLAKHPRFKLHFTPTSAVLAQSRRALLRRDHEQAHPARRLHQRRRARGRRSTTTSTATTPTPSPSSGPRPPRHPPKGTPRPRYPRNRQSRVPSVRSRTLAGSPLPLIAAPECDDPRARSSYH